MISLEMISSHMKSSSAGVDFGQDDFNMLKSSPAEDDFVDAINPDSLIVKSGWVEPGLPGRVPEVGSWQFERTGYFCLDKDSTSEQLVFNQTVGLRDTWAKIGD